MDKKYGGCWLVIGVAIMAFMTCSFAMAADKVVVVPLNTSPKNVSLKVYDNGGQYLEQTIKSAPLR